MLQGYKRESPPHSREIRKFPSQGANSALSGARDAKTEAGNSNCGMRISLVPEKPHFVDFNINFWKMTFYRKIKKLNGEDLRK